MTTEQDKTLAALKTAIKMEVDGKNFYTKASQESTHELGKRLLESLAAEEDIHRQRFEEIYEAIHQKKAWPRKSFKGDGGRHLRTIFARASEKIGKDIKVPTTELGAVQIAMNMESQTYDFYKAQSKRATHEAEKDYYEALAAQEMEHHLILNDYYEYIKDPAAWFVAKEHPSLDGG